MYSMLWIPDWCPRNTCAIQLQLLKVWYEHQYVRSESCLLRRTSVAVRCQCLVSKRAFLDLCCCHPTMQTMWCSLQFFITALAFATFAVSPELPQNRLQLSFTLMLTSVAFKFVINTHLPKISYLTYMVSKTFSLHWCSALAVSFLGMANGSV